MMRAALPPSRRKPRRPRGRADTKLPTKAPNRCRRRAQNRCSDDPTGLGRCADRPGAQIEAGQLPPQAFRDKAEPKPQTPADIINARGFWGDAPTRPIRPRRRRSQPSGRARPSAPPIRNRPPAFPRLSTRRSPTRRAASPVDRANVIAASAPIPRNVRPDAQCRRSRHRNQYRRRQGPAGPGQRDLDLDAPRRRQGQRSLDAGRDAGAEREQRDVDHRARRYRHDR